MDNNPAKNKQKGIGSKYYQTALGLLAVFLLICIFAVALVFLIKGGIDYSAKNLAPTVVCSKLLTEEECMTQDRCQGIYAPECQTCKNLKFVECQQIPDKDYLSLAKQKDLCLRTGGYWYRNKLGSFCLCQNTISSSKFDPARGCIAK